MAKLGVGVGDEFPTEEIVRDADGTVHHHHYYRRRRRPFGGLQVVLAIAWVILVFHLLHVVVWDMGWDLPFLPHGYVRFAANLIGLLAVTAAIWFFRRDACDRR